MDLHLDSAQLKKRYYALSKEHHPDYFGQAESAEKQGSINMTIHLNDAYRTLSDLDLRIAHLLKINGKEIEESGNQMDQSFLMEMMDINEAIMEAQMGDDSGIKPAIKKAEEFESGLNKAIEDIKSSWNTEEILPENLDSLKSIYLKRKYLKRLQANLANALG